MMTWKCSDAQAMTFAAAKPTPELAPVIRTVVDDMVEIWKGLMTVEMLWMDGLRKAKGMLLEEAVYL